MSAHPSRRVLDLSIILTQILTQPVDNTYTQTEKSKPLEVHKSYGQGTLH